MSLIMVHSLVVSTVSTLVMAAPRAMTGNRFSSPTTRTVSGSRSLLPVLLPWPEIHLEGPGAAVLAMELPVGLGNVVGVEDGVRSGVVALGEVGFYPFGVDGAVDHDMGDMDVLGCEFTRHRLRQRPHCVLAAGEGREAAAAAQGGRRTGEDHGAISARHHRLGRLSRRQKAGEGRHLPDLAIDAGRGVANVEADVAADIEDEDFDLADLGLDLTEELDDLRLVAGVGAEGVDLAALLHDLRHQMLQLLGAAPRHHGGEAFAGEAAGDGAARRIAGADHDADLVPCHGSSPCPLSFGPICRPEGAGSREITSWPPEAACPAS